MQCDCLCIASITMKTLYGTLEKLLTADTTDLRELAILAKFNPNTFYRYTDLSDIDISGQDLTGMQFKSVQIATLITDNNTVLPKRTHVRPTFWLPAEVDHALWLIKLRHGITIGNQLRKIFSFASKNKALFDQTSNIYRNEQDWKMTVQLEKSLGDELNAWATRRHFTRSYLRNHILICTFSNAEFLKKVFDINTKLEFEYPLSQNERKNLLMGDHISSYSSEEEWENNRVYVTGSRISGPVVVKKK